MKKIRCRKFLKTVIILFVMLCVLTGVEKQEVHAETEADGSSLSGDVKVLKDNRKGYVMQVTVENNGNKGENFTGIVQVIFANPYSEEYTGSANCAYNTEITLPAQEKKQFTITVTDFAVDYQKGLCALNFIDEDETVIKTISLRDVFGYSAVREIQAGVLSDNFEDLNFLMKSHVAFHNSIRAINPNRLNNANINEKLDELCYLIIDRFDVSSLSKENIQAIQDWVRNGGLLIIGTGAYAEQTLSGFDKDFIDVEVLDISEPGEENVLTTQEEYYSSINDWEVDFTNMAVADLKDKSADGYFYLSYLNPAMCSSIGDGMVMIFNFSLEEEELQKGGIDVSTIYHDFVLNMYYNYYHFEEYSEISSWLLSFMDMYDADENDENDENEENEGFIWVKAIFIFIVAVSIPILYLILHRCKKYRWLWTFAYVFGIIILPISGIILVRQNNSFGKNNVQGKETRVYSVTTQRVDGNRADTYLMACSDSKNPWEIRLKDNYVTASPGNNSNSFIMGNYGPDTSEYYYTVSNDGNGLSVGIKPGEDKEGFFYAEGRTDSKGMISCKDFRMLDLERGDIDRTLTNGTDYDMAYIAVWLGNHDLIIFSDVKAGETINLNQAIKDERYFEMPHLFYKNDWNKFHFDDDYSDTELDDISALLIGMGIAEDEKPRRYNRAIIVGLVKEYDKVTDDECNEISYGCFYTYAEPGEEQ